MSDKMRPENNNERVMVFKHRRDIPGLEKMINTRLSNLMGVEISHVAATMKMVDNDFLYMVVIASYEVEDRNFRTSRRIKFVRTDAGPMTLENHFNGWLSAAAEIDIKSMTPMIGVLSEVLDGGETKETCVYITVVTYEAAAIEEQDNKEEAAA
ncbi:MAG TPA: hypothetical protein VJH33_02555 [Candidatus Paceibacterota bacterium]